MKIVPIKTVKGRDGIEVNKFRYRKDKTLSTGEINWRCTNRLCSASLKTNHAITSVKNKPSLHNHDPLDTDIDSSPSASKPSTPTLSTDFQKTPSPSTTIKNTSVTPLTLPLETQTPSLTELLSPYVKLAPEPCKFLQLDKENEYLREKMAEMVYINRALTDKVAELSKQLMQQNTTNTTLEKPETTTQEESNLLKFPHADEKGQNNSLDFQPGIRNKKSVSISTQTETFAISALEGIHVLEADMADVIDEMRGDSSVAFAHSISGDFCHPRQMTAGVAVIFKAKFGRPHVGDCLTRSLAYQSNTGGAGVYSLVTKPNYNGKPTENDYDIAFDDLAEDFKKKGFNTLICSPMGCVRDLIELDHFAAKITQLHDITGATIVIVTKDQKARRMLRHGLTHTEFVKQLKLKITKCQHAANWYLLPDEDIKLYLENIVIPKNTLVLEPAVSHLLKENNNSEEVVKMIQDLRVDTYEYLLAPLNDRSDDGKEGGTHWSLLFYTRATNTYYHLDSLEPLNNRHAERLATQLSGDPCVEVVRLRCARQKQSVECGAYVLHFIDLLLCRITNKLPVQDDRCFVQKCDSKISKIYDIIEKHKKIIKTKNKSEKHKVTLLSDSHGRGLRHLLQNKLGEESEVFCVVKPNATFEGVTSGLDCQISKLGSSDHLIVLGGTNNISLRSNFDVRSCVKEIAEKTKNTNVILCTVPLRYDIPELNRKIKKINIDLVIEALKYDHLKVVSLSGMLQKAYTHHGLHFNFRGKQNLANLIVEQINTSFNLN